MDDELLVSQVVQGNREAFRLLVVRYQRPLFRFLGLLGFRAAETEDIAQETFLRAYRSIGNFDPQQAKFSTWLFTIAKRLASNERGRAYKRFETPFVTDSEAQSSSLNQADALHSAECLVRLNRALQSLPEQLRSTFFLSQIKELALEQVADLEGCAVGTVKSRIFRAREQLRLALADKEP